MIGAAAFVLSIMVMVGTPAAFMAPVRHRADGRS